MFAKTAVCLALATMAASLDLGRVVTLRCKPTERAIMDSAQNNYCRCVNNATQSPFFSTGPNCVSVPLNPECDRVWEAYGRAQSNGSVNNEAFYHAKACTVKNCLPKPQCPAGSVGNPTALV